MIGWPLVSALALAGFALVLLAWLLARRELRRVRRAHAEHVATLSRLLGQAQADAMAAEARSRDVGGTGKHGAPDVVALSPITRQWTIGRDPARAIPTERGSSR